MSDSLQPHELQHARPPCPSPTPGVHPNSSPLSWWCHPTISSCRPLLLPSIFPSIRVFPNESTHCIRWLKNWSFSISPSNKPWWLAFIFVTQVPNLSFDCQGIPLKETSISEIHSVRLSGRNTLPDKELSCLPQLRLLCFRDLGYFDNWPFGPLFSLQTSKLQIPTLVFNIHP